MYGIYIIELCMALAVQDPSDADLTTADATPAIITIATNTNTSNDTFLWY